MGRPLEATPRALVRKRLPAQLVLPVGGRERVLNRQIGERAAGKAARPGPGRPKKRGAVSHLPRPRLGKGAALHVTLRVNEHVPNLRTRRRFGEVRKALAKFCDLSPEDGPGFRVVHFVVLGNHLHLVVEADSKSTLSKGMQRLALSVSRRLNALSVRQHGGALTHGSPFRGRPGYLGRVFAARFHAHRLQTPAEVRNVIAYVLFNAEHHYATGATERTGPRRCDPFSSAPFFAGLAKLARWTGTALASMTSADNHAPSPVAVPRGWLLLHGWQKFARPQRLRSP